MNRYLRVVCLVFIIGMASAEFFLACGDKFLVASRGTRYQKAPIKRDAHAILILVNPMSDVAKALNGVPIDETLRKVGYRPTTVGSVAEFDSALSRGGFDLLIVGASEAAAVSKRQSGSNAPIVLPVLLNPTSKEMKQVKMQFDFVLKGPAKRDAFLNAVDEALAKRSKKV